MTPDADPDADTDHGTSTAQEIKEVTQMPEWKQYIANRSRDRELLKYVRDKAPEPVTTREAATGADMKRRTAHNRLNKLLDVGAPIQTKTIGEGSNSAGALARIWWYDSSADDPAQGSD